MNITIEKTNCPYCQNRTPVELPENYEPVYAHCDVCSKKFIVERLAEGFEALTLENAPCCSDPDCRDLELGGSDEQ